MTNKKSQVQIINAILIILLILAAIVIVWQVIKSTVEEEARKEARKYPFAIKKEMCREENREDVCISTFPRNTTMSIDEMVLRAYDRLLEENEFASVNTANKEIYLRGDYFEVVLTARYPIEFCEHVKVDGVRIDYECYLNGSYKENPENCLVLFEVKKKQDLSLNWLEENCECIEGYVKNYAELSEEDIKTSKRICEGTIALGGLSSECDILDEMICKKYKYREYIVEVK